MQAFAAIMCWLIEMAVFIFACFGVVAFCFFLPAAFFWRRRVQHRNLQSICHANQLAMCVDLLTADGRKHALFSQEVRKVNYVEIEFNAIAIEITETGDYLPEVKVAIKMPGKKDAITGVFERISNGYRFCFDREMGIAPQDCDWLEVGVYLPAMVGKIAQTFYAKVELQPFFSQDVYQTYIDAADAAQKYIRSRHGHAIQVHVVPFRMCVSRRIPLCLIRSASDSWMWALMLRVQDFHSGIEYYFDIGNTECIRTQATRWLKEIDTCYVTFLNQDGGEPSYSIP